MHRARGWPWPIGALQMTPTELPPIRHPAGGPPAACEAAFLLGVKTGALCHMVVFFVGILVALHRPARVRWYTANVKGTPAARRGRKATALDSHVNKRAGLPKRRHRYRVAAAAAYGASFFCRGKPPSRDCPAEHEVQPVSRDSGARRRIISQESAPDNVVDGRDERRGCNVGTGDRDSSPRPRVEAKPRKAEVHATSVYIVRLAEMPVVRVRRQHQGASRQPGRRRARRSTRTARRSSDYKSVPRNAP